MQRISSAGDVLTVLTPTVVVREAPSASSIEDCCKTQGSRDDVATLLKQKADPNQVDAKGSSILMRAVWYENLGIIEALLEAKADANAKNHRLNTAVHFAYEKNNAQIIDLLVTHGGAFSVRRFACSLVVPAINFCVFASILHLQRALYLTSLTVFILLAVDGKELTGKNSAPISDSGVLTNQLVR